jgi:hypothetical protein
MSMAAKGRKNKGNVARLKAVLLWVLIWLLGVGPACLFLYRELGWVVGTCALAIGILALFSIVKTIFRLSPNELVGRYEERDPNHSSCNTISPASEE